MVITPEPGAATRPRSADSAADPAGAKPSPTPSEDAASLRRRARVGDELDEPPTPRLAELGLLDPFRAPPARASPEGPRAATPRSRGERRTRRGGGSETDLPARLAEALRAESPALDDDGCWAGSLAWRPPARDGVGPSVGGGGDDPVGERSSTRHDRDAAPAARLGLDASPPPGSFLPLIGGGAAGSSEAPSHLTLGGLRRAAEASRESGAPDDAAPTARPPAADRDRADQTVAVPRPSPSNAKAAAALGEALAPAGRPFPSDESPRCPHPSGGPRRAGPEQAAITHAPRVLSGFDGAGRLADGAAESSASAASRATGGTFSVASPARAPVDDDDDAITRPASPPRPMPSKRSPPGPPCERLMGMPCRPRSNRPGPATAPPDGAAGAARPGRRAVSTCGHPREARSPGLS